MAPKLNKFHCPWCKKVFLSYERDRKFCTDACKGSYDYGILIAKGKYKPEPEIKNCAQCGCECNKTYCTTECQKLAERIPYMERKKPRGNLHKIDMDADNKRAEKERVFDDNYAYRYIIGKTRDRI